MVRSRQSNAKKLPKYLGKTDMEELLKKAKELNKRDYLILLTMYRTGARVSEITSLRVEDIDFEGGLIAIRDGKGGKDRIIPLEENLSTILGFYTDSMKLKDVIFDVSTRTVRRIVKKYARHDWVSPHTLRHSFAVRCLKGGVDLVSLQKILGHADLNTTQVYLELTGEDVKESFGRVVW